MDVERMMRVRNLGRWVLAGAALAMAGADLAQGENKKPGLFDFETWKSPVAREREAAGRLAPDGLDLTPAVPPTSEPRVIRVRVYADTDYRGVVLRWQARLRAQFARINGVAGPVFNVSFEIESLRNWDRSHAGTPLEPLMKELAALDDGRQVDLVLGLVTPARGVATAMHQVGQAFTPGRHIIMRGRDDEEEGKALEREFHLLSEVERSRLYSDRRSHKETVLFLHEWGHSAGLLHQEDRTTIMNPTYDSRQSGFSDFDKQVLALVVAERVAHRDQEFPERADLLTLYQKAPPEIGSAEERAHLLSFLGERSERKPPQVTQVSGMSPNDAEAFDRAMTAAKGNHQKEAWTIFAPVLQRLRGRNGTTEEWTRAAQAAVAMGALSVADEAIGHLPRGGAEVEAMAANAELFRQRVALPPPAISPVPIDREPAYVADYLATSNVIQSAAPPQARTRLEAFAAAYPDSAGTDLLACELDMRTSHTATAAQRCEVALSKYRYAERAHVLLGMQAARSGHPAVAEQHLETAIRQDPHDSDAWRALARLFRSEKAKGRLDQLARRHQAAFSAPLPE